MADGYRIKLVRDRVEEIGPGRAFTYKPCRNRDEHVHLLRQKLGEEVVEYLLDPSVGELADILEVIESLAWLDLGVTWEEIDQAADQKFRERGGFREGTVMEAVEVEGG